MIRGTKSFVLIIPLYSSPLGPYLTKGIQFGGAQCKIDVDRLQQAGVIKVVSVETLLCGERLEDLGLHSLEEGQLWETLAAT